MKTRFIQSVLHRAQAAKAELPWSRGRRRAAMIARRKPVATSRSSA